FPQNLQADRLQEHSRANGAECGGLLEHFDTVPITSQKNGSGLPRRPVADNRDMQWSGCHDQIVASARSRSSISTSASSRPIDSLTRFSGSIDGLYRAVSAGNTAQRGNARDS